MDNKVQESVSLTRRVEEEELALWYEEDSNYHCPHELEGRIRTDSNKLIRMLKSYFADKNVFI